MESALIQQFKKTKICAETRFTKPVLVSEIAQALVAEVLDVT